MHITLIPEGGGIFFLPKKNRQHKQTYFKIILQALLLVTKQAEPIKGLLTAVHSFVVLTSTLQYMPILINNFSSEQFL